MRIWVGCLLVLLALGCSSPPSAETPAYPQAAAPLSASPAAATSSAAATPLDLAGVPKYPGSTQAGSAVSPESGGATHFNVLLTTSDSVDKVATFYREQLGFQSSSKDGVTQFVGRSKQGADVLMFIQPDQGQTQITVKGILYSKKQP